MQINIKQSKSVNHDRAVNNMIHKINQGLNLVSIDFANSRQYNCWDTDTHSQTKKNVARMISVRT
jgi:hypothetical protein